jgi:hypothetical protein
MKVVSLLFKAGIVLYAASDITDILSHHVKWLKKLESL